jgi:hypothetical protein
LLRSVASTYNHPLNPVGISFSQGRDSQRPPDEGQVLGTNPEADRIGGYGTDAGAGSNYLYSLSLPT